VAIVVVEVALAVVEVVGDDDDEIDGFVVDDDEVDDDGNSSTQGFIFETPIKLIDADSDPDVGTIPIVCIRLRVTSNGYVNVCANNPDNAPHCNRSIVVGSRCIMCDIRSLACSFIINAVPE
jgi:hypothetical protein